ncbi:hypothetical protein MPTK1_1g23240 [Marchantia polymorpha subsp. ruderalis]|uniref:Uncharacterized protein n=2 Tax=Marchantia polymorpha TaxID=3197 RepID=A0AAF6ATE2_MARPO|nr:hypothetical protein MARPO_0065s0054 [Marchantia polymorpha]BBM99712.1 hypothetical protein Mp_1g23240 [Marchantia polymorpha subsp. ruderalis]|eukprot:PTQ36244.1 hypothetical protein MARPO_0065s0054 [Marchantia polymorpha]
MNRFPPTATALPSSLPPSSWLYMEPHEVAADDQTRLALSADADCSLEWARREWMNKIPFRDPITVEADMDGKGILVIRSAKACRSRSPIFSQSAVNWTDCCAGSWSLVLLIGTPSSA